ncbi:hypothetical protein SBF1_1940009 [Candidatus Desulfosporosinus infrequens]|uniref:Uncharacterized protein n=1 Tax=Candidatus Desulfosporosinus infrequens TaxID=2043169 RepID=A0A2U3KGB5_9FIRM|nr:hypothetical protein SBF1_1940009 [Candidatus Desulfosporosinus infrequens]
MDDEVRAIVSVREKFSHKQREEQAEKIGQQKNQSISSRVFPKKAKITAQQNSCQN